MVAELKKLSKPSFDLDRILSAAGELKHTRGIKKVLEAELAEPSEELVRLFTSRVYSGRLTKGVNQQFTQIVRKAFKEFINERITDRLQSALEKETPDRDQEEIIEVATETPDIVTTEEELEGFQIVRAILSEVVDPERIFHRDRKSYFGVLLDDNNRKPICRLWFNAANKYIGLINADKNERREPITNLTDIFKHAQALRETVAFYE